MPRGKEFCQRENDFFDQGEFELIGGTLVHRVTPPHRTDGVLVKVVQGKNGHEHEQVVPVNNLDIDPTAGRSLA